MANIHTRICTSGGALQYRDGYILALIMDWGGLQVSKAWRYGYASDCGDSKDYLMQQIIGDHYGTDENLGFFSYRT